MYARPLWRPILLLAVTAGLAGCASQAPDVVATGDPGATSASTSIATTVPVSSPAPSTSVPATGVTGTGPASTTSTVPAATASQPSPVAGLSAAELRSAVLAATTSTRARIAGPVAEQVRLPGGTSVWRVRLPGAFPVRSARVTVFVDGHRVGQGVVGPHLRSLVAVTRSAAGLRDGALVTFRWDGSTPVSAGRLTVVR